MTDKTSDYRGSADRFGGTSGSPERSKGQGAEAAPKRSGDDMAQVKEDLVTLKESAGNLASSAGASAAQALRDVGESVSIQAGNVASEAAHAVNVASEHAKTFASEIEAFARRNPLGAMAGALVAGVLIGLIGRGRS